MATSSIAVSSPSPQVDHLLEPLLHGHISEGAYVIQSSRLPLLEEILTKIKEQDAPGLTAALVDVLLHHAANRSRVCEDGLHRRLLLQSVSELEKGDFQTACSYVRLASIIFSHSSAPSDIQFLLSTFNRLSAKHGTFPLRDSALPILQHAIAGAPPLEQSFQFSGRKSSIGIVGDRLPEWSKHGFSVACWLQIESLPDQRGHWIYYVKSSATQYVGLGIANDKLIAYCCDNGRLYQEELVASFSTSIGLRKWWFMTVVHTPRTLWRDSVDLYVGGRQRATAKIKYPSQSSMKPLEEIKLGG